jgi:hypothetical protein
MQANKKERRVFTDLSDDSSELYAYFVNQVYRTKYLECDKHIRTSDLLSMIKSDINRIIRNKHEEYFHYVDKAYYENNVFLEVSFYL